MIFDNSISGMGYAPDDVEPEDMMVQCSDCEKYFPDGMMSEIDGLKVCPDCEENYWECERCGDIVHKDFITEVYGVRMCENCIED